MSFCCGATMIGAVGSLRQGSILVHNVPLFYCPVCHQMEVYPVVKDEFELVVELARGDGVHEVYMRESIDSEVLDEWKEYVTSFQQDNPEVILREQVDMALDLLGVARWLEDRAWEEELKIRLQVLSRQIRRLNQQGTGS